MSDGVTRSCRITWVGGPWSTCGSRPTGRSGRTSKASGCDQSGVPVTSDERPSGLFGAFFFVCPTLNP